MRTLGYAIFSSGIALFDDTRTIDPKNIRQILLFLECHESQEVDEPLFSIFPTALICQFDSDPN